jgi:sulfur carrier protein
MGKRVLGWSSIPRPSGREDFLFIRGKEHTWMKLIVNGEHYLTETDTLAKLLEELEIVPERVAVEVNLMVIKRKDFGDCRLKDGDSIEVVYFVGGGQ